MFSDPLHAIPGSDLLLAALPGFLAPCLCAALAKSAPAKSALAKSALAKSILLVEGALGEGNDDVLVAVGIVLLCRFLQHVVQGRILVSKKYDIVIAGQLRTNP